MTSQSFEIKDDFYLDGQKIKIISGGIHYFRVVPEYWRDRLEKLKALGCNTVETYVAWNVHEPKKGAFRFEGRYDLKKFIEIAASLGLYVIVRPSPYICAEWEFGGLPGWLLAEEGMKFRGAYEPFLNHVRDYYQELFKILTPLQIDKGGPILMMQIENEYGYYGDDKTYLEDLKTMMQDFGTTVPLVTSDGPWGDALNCGSVEGVLATGNFGSKTISQFEALKAHVGVGPLMCMEFWVGWFDHWGSPAHTVTDWTENVKELEEILKQGHVNIYMFHGGTNFGFMNGANYYDVLTPDVTSYDYDAILTESGELTQKYHAFKEVIGKYTEIPVVALSTKIVKKAYGNTPVLDKVSLNAVLEDISEKTESRYTQSMEKLGQSYGYILYRSVLKYEKNIEKIRLYEANDRAQFFVNQQPVLTLYDRELLTESSLALTLTDNSILDILVENMGRVNFGVRMEKQRKGIDGGVQINGHHHFNWQQFTLSFDNLAKLDYSKGYEEGVPAFYRFELEVDEIGDTYLDFEGWGKGCVFINGENIGRFWEIGPQKRLYVPGPLLKLGKNEIILFETEGKVGDGISFKEVPDLG